ncbi:MAG: peptide deformylase [Candidatus Odinarchaeota archaeon]
MTVRKILLLGNPQLHKVSGEIEESELASLHSIIQDLHDTMMAYRAEYGAGRAIAAPQIGVMKRLIYMHINEPMVFINPVLKNLSDEKIEVWDDCMSFPDLIVRVLRHRSCTIEYRDEKWNHHTLELVDDLSELLQHEYDHLNGILAVSRAMDGYSYALRSERHFLKKS